MHFKCRHDDHVYVFSSKVSVDTLNSHEFITVKVEIIINQIKSLPPTPYDESAHAHIASHEQSQASWAPRHKSLITRHEKKIKKLGGWGVSPK